MKIIKINLGHRSYSIIIGNKCLSSLGKYLKTLNLGTDAYIITNSLINKKYGKILCTTLKKYGFNSKIKLIPDTENSKSILTASAILKDIARFDKKKRIFIIAFGGGVVGDVAGFVASIYKRGTAYVQIPTTLLAQVDSSIGGKTAIDLSEGKNLVGAFYQPRLVFSDVGLLKTLDKRQLKAGLAEVIKYAVIKDPKFFSFLENNLKNISGFKNSSFELIVATCAAIKVKITQEDEREEKGIRTILNFGHTIGHAIEAASGFKGYNHGEAIALGMLVACNISNKLNLLDIESCERIKNLIKNTGLPVTIRGISEESIIKTHLYDKKFVGAKNKFVLLRKIGKTAIVENIAENIIRGALKNNMVAKV